MACYRSLVDVSSVTICAVRKYTEQAAGLAQADDVSGSCRVFVIKHSSEVGDFAEVMPSAGPNSALTARTRMWFSTRLKREVRSVDDYS